jgi:hypothetical protein
VLFEYGCERGHRFERSHRIGQAPAIETCPIHDLPAQRVYSVPTLILTYPVSFNDAQEQVAAEWKRREQTWVRPSHEELMDRVRRRVDAERRTERAGLEGARARREEAPPSAAA